MYSQNPSAIKMRQWRSKNHAKARAIEMRYDESHRESRQAAHRVYYAANRQAILERTKKYRVECKAKVIAHYGNRCACCNEREPIFLTVDHINGGGLSHRRQIGKANGGIGFYIWIVNNNFPPLFQILCFNCNWAKSHGGCPHKPAEVAA